MRFRNQCGYNKENVLTSSSKSKNVSALASLTSSNAFAPFVASLQPRRSLAPLGHPGMKFPQGTEKTRFGIWLPESETVIASKSGKPSRFASPSLRAMGKDGVKDVS
jgi:hypothetical protein